jgi:hypothetical protein
MSGSYVGFGAMVGGSTIAPRVTPSLSFWTDRGMEPYRIDKAIEVAQRVFGRRDRPWTPLDEQMMRYVADIAPSLE